MDASLKRYLLTGASALAHLVVLVVVSAIVARVTGLDDTKLLIGAIGYVACRTAAEASK